MSTADAVHGRAIPGLTFEDCLFAAWADDGFMTEYRRLTGSSIGLDARQPVERLVDAATGFRPVHSTPKEALHFVGFVWEVVWRRLPPAAGQVGGPARRG